MKIPPNKVKLKGSPISWEKFEEIHKSEIKYSSLNKVHRTYFNYCAQFGTFGALLKGTYGPFFVKALNTPNPFLNIIKPTNSDIWSTPIILGTEHGCAFGVIDEK